MEIYTVAFVVILGAALLIYGRLTATPNPYDDRECTGTAWKQAFPDSSSSSIRAYLDCLVDGMDLPQDRLSFGPDDRVIEIYRSLFGGRTPLGDDFECETFLWNVEKKFGVSPDKILDNVWTDEHVTLGQIFEFINAK